MNIKPRVSLIKNENGSVLIVAMLILVLLTLIGIAATSTSIVEMQISGNEKLSKMAFYAADGGGETAPGIIGYYILERPDPAGFADNLRVDLQGIMQDPNFLNEVMGYTANNDGASSLGDSPPDLDIQTAIGAQTANIDVDRIGAKPLAGGAVEFGGGYEGVGAGGASGGIAIFYQIDSQGAAANNARSEVITNYRKVVGIGE